LKGRVFSATKQGELVFFKPYDVRETAGTMYDTGRIQLPAESGVIVDMVGAGDYVYVFCENGIFRVKVTANAYQFVIESVPYGGGNIIAGTACATSNNGEIFFVASDGVCTLNGKTVTRHGSLNGVSVKIRGGSGRSMQVDDKYVVGVDDNYGTRSWFAVDLLTKQAYPCDVPAYTTACLGGAIGVYNNQIFRLRMHNGGSLYKETIFQTTLNFGTDKEKVLRSLFVDGMGGCWGYVESEYGRKEFDLVAGEGVSAIRMKGKRFTVRLQMATGCIFNGMTAEVDTLV
jgi:hypothetical protein